MNIAIIGYGKMGKFYDSLLKADYIVDTLPIKGRMSFANVDELIAYAQPLQLVIVCTPIHTHYEVVRKLLTAGYNVLCEKPISVSSRDANDLETLAHKNNLLLYQSTLERYNPIIKFMKKNIATEEIDWIESFRFGNMPQSIQSINPLFDLGVHDIDLWFYLTECKVKWELHAGYGKPQRLIKVHLSNGSTLSLDLLEKQIMLPDGTILDLTRASANNPIIEMIYDIIYKGTNANEAWSNEIKRLENADGELIVLCP
ncbi:MAG: Gfo/Idh/MocA family oxidoreductase [Pedobacter sp.]|nr:Gfo/Idh/MocA family oxidoreductase [Pedobacter sp.]